MPFDLKTTRVLTTCGMVDLRDLTPGDMVLGRGRGPVEVLDVQRVTMNGRGAAAPITILPGALGNRHMLRLSPETRLCLSGWRAQLHGDGALALVALRDLINGKTVFADPRRRVTYGAVICAEPALIDLGGLWADGRPLYQSRKGLAARLKPATKIPKHFANHGLCWPHGT
jgi:hypothetical protein